MASIQVRVTAELNVPVLGCPRCDTALVPVGEWPKGGLAETRCPLCGWEQPLEVVEVGGESAVPFNLAQQQQDVEATPIYQVDSVAYDEDLVLVDIPSLLEDPAFYALQDGIAPVFSFGWVGGTDLLGEGGYRLFLIVRVTGLPQSDLFRIEFPVGILPNLAQLDQDKTVVLVSQRKGVFFPESGEVYCQAMQENGASPGDLAPVNTWVQLEETDAG